ncbi:hypothetical protein B0H14DRAFT_3696328 [Mycena olivaceomarginata]|nr:hypothetical protein B0H14DRAFT_3696328 [Mycena olivaceomarginata]
MSPQCCPLHATTTSRSMSSTHPPRAGTSPARQLQCRITCPLCPFCVDTPLQSCLHLAAEPSARAVYPHLTRTRPAWTRPCSMPTLCPRPSPAAHARCCAVPSPLRLATAPLPRPRIHFVSPLPSRALPVPASISPHPPHAPISRFCHRCVLRPLWAHIYAPPAAEPAERHGGYMVVVRLVWVRAGRRPCRRRSRTDARAWSGTPPGSTNPFITPRMRESRHVRRAGGGVTCARGQGRTRGAWAHAGSGGQGAQGKAERTEADIAGARGGGRAGDAAAAAGDAAAAAAGAAAKLVLEELDEIQSSPGHGTSAVWAIRAMNDGSPIVPKMLREPR